MTAMQVAAISAGIEAKLCVRLGLADDAYNHAVAAFRAAACITKFQQARVKTVNQQRNEITDAIIRGRYVYAQGADACFRITRARVRNGRLYGYRLSSGTWIAVTEYAIEGY